jgi:hypothetical protein
MVLSSIAHPAQFTNPNNVPPAEPNTMFILHPAFQKVYVVGDVYAWNAANPSVGAVEVVCIYPYFPQACIFVILTLLHYFPPHNDFAY